MIKIVIQLIIFSLFFLSTAPSSEAIAFWDRPQVTTKRHVNLTRTQRRAQRGEQLYFRKYLLTPQSSISKRSTVQPRTRSQRRSERRFMEQQRVMKSRPDFSGVPGFNPDLKFLGEYSKARRVLVKAGIDDKLVRLVDHEMGRMQLMTGKIATMGNSSPLAGKAFDDQKSKLISQMTITEPQRLALRAINGYATSYLNGTIKLPVFKRQVDHVIRSTDNALLKKP